ncbi:cation diffusion facilitator family transporter [Bacillus sp. JJ722]|uniref:cation diffusion facilitator family transporter n=1 Tax=Bacillus sp. JJ722 TaxID=3122973 RepID=UPI002FFDCB96
MENQKYNDLKSGERGAMISIAAYIVLSIIKLTMGYVSGSDALKADGFNNTTDIIASIAVLIGLKIAQKPPDKDHRYGHWKSETIASLIASFIMFAVGIQVLTDTVRSLFQGEKASPDIMAAYVGIFSALVMYFVYRYNRNLGARINSKAVMAAAKDNISDAWVSIGTAIGIFGSQLNMPWLDSLTAFIVGLLICKTAWDIFRESTHELTDGFDVDKLSSYKSFISNVDGVEGIKEIKGRNYGNNEVIDAIIFVNQSLNISEAHDIATQVETKMKNEHGVYNIHIHVEPSYENTRNNEN